MNPLSCASETRRTREIWIVNSETIWSDESTGTFSKTEEVQHNGTADSSCYYACDTSTGRLQYVGSTSLDPKLIPNCMVKRSKTDSMGGFRKTRYFVYLREALGVSAMREIARTERELNKNFVKDWTQFARTKLKTTYETLGWYELGKWAYVYREIFELKDVTWTDLVFKS